MTKNNKRMYVALKCFNTSEIKICEREEKNSWQKWLLPSMLKTLIIALVAPKLMSSSHRRSYRLIGRQNILF